jgi:hypothetical protein
MDSGVKASFKNAITKSLPILQPLTTQYTEPYLVYNRTGDQSWEGKFEDRPSLSHLFVASWEDLNQHGLDFVQSLKAVYPEYGNLVGFPGFAMNILSDPSFILRSALGELWQRYGTFQCSEDAVDALVNEFEEFIDRPTIGIRYVAQLFNYRMDAEQIDFPAGMIIRRLSEEELSEIEGGPMQPFRQQWSFGIWGIQDYALEGEHEALKIFGSQEIGDSTTHELVRQDIARAILTLRTFKEGRVGYNYVRFKSVKFCPVPMGAFGSNDLFIPHGEYYVSEQEIDTLQRHAELIFSVSEPTMEMACSRLADAQTRLQARDRLVDAVIGLEALLLAGLRGEDRRGELKYRFALHYSTLFASPEERYRSFRVAKDIYDLRSTIAHGDMPKGDKCRLGDEKVNLAEAAQRACEMLRFVISYFLPQSGEMPYKDPFYWEKGYFGLTPKPD